MPYLGRSPAISNTVTGDLAVSGSILADGQISGGRINHKLALNGSDAASPQANENDQFLIEDGGSDGSGTNAGDNILLEDGTGSQEFLPTTESGGLRSVQIFDASGTYTKPSGISFVKVTVVGAGGGGGGKVNDRSAGGGAGGGTSIKYIDAADVGSTETVTVGTGGADNTGADGAAGGTSSFGSHCSATGGGGGQATANPDASAVGGSGSGGDINIDGEGAHCSTWNSGHTVGGDVQGGASSLGFGGVSSYQTAAWDGKGFGGGGAGRHQGNAAGGNGTDGVVIVEEYK